MSAHSFAFCSFIRNTLITIQWTVPWATWCSPWNMMLSGTKSISVSCSGVTFSLLILLFILNPFPAVMSYLLFSNHLSPGLVSCQTSLSCRWGQLMKGLVSGTVSLLCFEIWLLLWTLNRAHWYLFLDNCECFLGPTIKPLFSQIKQAKCTRHPRFRIRHQMDNIGQCVWVEEDSRMFLLSNPCDTFNDATMTLNWKLLISVTGVGLGHVVL